MDQRASAAAKQPPEHELRPEKPAWDRQPDENDLWYERFRHYLKLGPGRSVSLASTGKRNAYPVPSHWMIVAKEKRWRERAAAYDRKHGLIEESGATQRSDA